VRLIFSFIVFPVYFIDFDYSDMERQNQAFRAKPSAAQD